MNEPTLEDLIAQNGSIEPSPYPSWMDALSQMFSSPEASDQSTLSGFIDDPSRLGFALRDRSSTLQDSADMAKGYAAITPINRGYSILEALLSKPAKTTEDAALRLVEPTVALQDDAVKLDISPEYKAFMEMLSRGE
jgi:hypothetical protein